MLFSVSENMMAEAQPCVDTTLGTYDGFASLNCVHPPLCALHLHESTLSTWLPCLSVDNPTGLEGAPPNPLQGDVPAQTTIFIHKTPLSTENVFLGNAQSKVDKEQLHSILSSIDDCMDCQSQKATTKEMQESLSNMPDYDTHVSTENHSEAMFLGETPWRILPQDPLLNIHKLPSGARDKVSTAPTSFFLLVHRPSHFLKGHTATSIPGMSPLQQSTCCSQSRTAGVDQQLMWQRLLRAELSGLCV